MQTMTSPIQWGNVTLDQTMRRFAKPLAVDAACMRDDCEYESPHVASCMNTLDATGSVLDEGGKGGYRFDRMALPGPFDILSWASFWGI